VASDLIREMESPVIEANGEHRRIHKDLRAVFSTFSMNFKSFRPLLYLSLRDRVTLICVKNLSKRL
jgi:hypothetical protein